MAKNKIYTTTELNRLRQQARFEARRRRISASVALDRTAQKHGFKSWEDLMDDHLCKMANLASIPTGRSSLMEAYHPEVFQEKKKEVKIVVKKRRTYTKPLEQVG